MILLHGVRRERVGGFAQGVLPDGFFASGRSDSDAGKAQDREEKAICIIVNR
jgi:hypothetical protein